MSVLDIGYMLQVCHIYSHARPHCRLVECFFLDLISYIYREYIWKQYWKWTILCVGFQKTAGNIIGNVDKEKIFGNTNTRILLYIYSVYTAQSIICGRKFGTIVWNILIKLELDVIDVGFNKSELAQIRSMFYTPSCVPTTRILRCFFETYFFFK